MGSRPDVSSGCLSPFFVSTKFFAGFLATDIMLSTAFSFMKSLVVFSPRMGTSSRFGTAGLLFSASGYVNGASENLSYKSF